MSATWARRYEPGETFAAVKEFRKRSIRRRRLVMGLVVGVVLALASLTGWALVNRGLAERSAEEARIAAEAAEASERDALEQQRLADASAEDARGAARLAEESGRDALNQKRLAETSASEARAAAERAEASSLRARDQARLAVASEFEDDPTTAALILAEMERPAETALAAPRMLEVLQRKLALEELRHDGPVRAASFSADGTRVVTASYDRTARVWDLADPQNPLVLEGHGSPVLAASFSADGTRVVTASDDQTARVWDLSDPQNPLVLEGHGDLVRAASFSADGTRVVTASYDRTARVWYYQLEDLRRVIRAATHVCLTSDFRQRHLGEPTEEADLRVAACEASQRR